MSEKPSTKAEYAAAVAGAVDGLSVDDDMTRRTSGDFSGLTLIGWKKLYDAVCTDQYSFDIDTTIRV
jgi:hypothetical protein